MLAVAVPLLPQFRQNLFEGLCFAEPLGVEFKLRWGCLWFGWGGPARVPLSALSHEGSGGSSAMAARMAASSSGVGEMWSGLSLGIVGHVRSNGASDA